MNEDDLRRKLRGVAGASPPDSGTWTAIVTEAERRTGGSSSMLHRFRVLSAAAGVVALAAVGLVALRSGAGGDGVREIRTGVPSVTGGSADLIVESTTIDDEGARLPVPETVAQQLAAVPGVRSVVGVVRAFTRLSRPVVCPPASCVAVPTWRPTVLVSWDGGDGFSVASGRAPSQPGELALTSALAHALKVEVGDEVNSEDLGASAPGAHALKLVGTFALAGGGSDVELGAVDLGQARELAHRSGFTRLHLELDPSADPAAVAEAAPSGYRVVGVNQLGTTEQLRDELGIQAAYFDFLDPDPGVRLAAQEAPVDTPESRATFERYRESAMQASFRIQRFSFLDADHAEVTYAIYYGSARSPIVHDPQTGSAVRIDGRWKLSTATKCALANLLQPNCIGGETSLRPPDGWDDPATEPEAVAAFRTLADPSADETARATAVLDGETNLAAVRQGLRDDQPYRGKVSFHISGVRSRGAGQLDVLFSLYAEGQPPIETPYPLIGTAVRDGGHWRANGQYICGLRALVGQGCSGGRRDS